MNIEIENQIEIGEIYNQLDEYFTYLNQLLELNPDAYTSYIESENFLTIPTTKSTDSIKKPTETGCFTMFKNCFNFLRNN